MRGWYERGGGGYEGEAGGTELLDELLSCGRRPFPIAHDLLDRLAGEQVAEVLEFGPRGRARLEGLEPLQEVREGLDGARWWRGQDWWRRVGGGGLVVEGWWWAQEWGGGEREVCGGEGRGLQRGRGGVCTGGGEGSAKGLQRGSGRGGFTSVLREGGLFERGVYWRGGSIGEGGVYSSLVVLAPLEQLEVLLPVDGV